MMSSPALATMLRSTFRSRHTLLSTTSGITPSYATLSFTTMRPFGRRPPRQRLKNSTRWSSVKWPREMESYLALGVCKTITDLVILWWKLWLCSQKKWPQIKCLTNNPLDPYDIIALWLGVKVLKTTAEVVLYPLALFTQIRTSFIQELLGHIY